MKRLYLLTMLLLLGLAAPQLYAAESLPYENSCDDLTTVVTENSTNKKWTVYNKECFRIQPKNTSTALDASVYFPEIEFEAGKTYVFEVTAKHLYNTTAGSFKLRFATGTTSSTCETPEIAVEENFQTKEYITYSYYYKVTETKTRRVALTVTSPGSCGYFYLTNFRVAESSEKLPDAPTAIMVTPDASGTKSADFSVTAPSKTVTGETLTSLKSLNVYTEGSLLHQISNPTPGQTYTFTKTMSRIGSYSFTFVGEVDEGEGKPAYANATIGSELPDWTKVSDYKGGGTRHAYLATFVPNVGVRLTLDSTKMSSVEGATYTVVRMPDNVVVAENAASPNVIDQSFPMSSTISYYYNVTITEPEATSSTTIASTVISINNAVEYNATFTDKTASREFTYFDIDKDASSWGTNNNGYMTSRNTNDMLVSPGVLLETGKTYRLTTAIMTSSNAAVGIKVLCGPSNHPDSMSTEVMPYQTESTKSFVNHVSYFTAPQAGNSFFGIHSYNEDSQKNYFNLCLQSMKIEEVPNDLAGPVEDFKVTFSSSTAGKISFVASPKNIVGETLTSLTRIDVYKDGELFTTINNPVIGQTYEFDITVESGVKYIYRAVPYNNSGEGVGKNLAVILITPPYSNELSTTTLVDGYTTIDGYADGFTWNIQNAKMRCYPGFGNGMDEWLVTPAVHLEGGKYYKTTFLTWSESADAGNTVSLWLGKSATADAMTQQVIAPYQMGTESTLLKDYFTVSETGEYYLGFHGENTNSRNSTPFYIKSFTISDSINAKVPGPGSLNVNPDRNGELACTVDIILPTKDINGDALESLTKAVVYYDGTSISTQNVTLGGTTEQVTVPNPTQGIHLFTLICSNEYGEGEEYETTAFIGINRPSYPTALDVKLTEKDGELTLTWEAPTTDYDGFDINPDLITYEVFEYTSSGEVQIADSIKELTYTYQAVPVDSAQQFKRVGVRAWTSAGGSQGNLAGVYAVGKPYELVWSESFANLETSTIFRSQSIDQKGWSAWGYNSEDPSGVTPVDDDGGFAIMEAIFKNGASGLATGRINLNIEKPLLKFYVMNRTTSTTVDENLLEVWVRPTNDEWHTVKSNTIDEWAGGYAGWQKVVVDLSEYKGQAVELMFAGLCQSFIYLNIDDISVGQTNNVDLSLVNLTLPDEAYPGKEFPVKVTVKNNGDMTYENALVNVYVNGNVRLTDTITLQAGEQQTLTLNDLITVAEVRDTSKFVYYAEVVAERDVDLVDNVSDEQTLNIVTDIYPTVNNLTGSVVDNAVVLTWDAPTIPTEAETFFDDFESYDSWSGIETGFGKYTLLDLDRQGISQFTNIPWPIALGAKQSFFIVDFSDTCFNAAHEATAGVFIAHSGNKAVGSMVNLSNSEYVADMFITPELCGEAQTISFYAKSIRSTTLESMRLMYSTTGKEYNDFTLLQVVSSIPAGEYTLYTVEVPEGTKYFAIYHFQANCSMLLIDDMTYKPAGNERLVIEGYYIYRNGELIGFVPAQDSNPITFTDNDAPDGENTYSVSVLYNRGESDTESVLVSFTGLADAVAYNNCNAFGTEGAIQVTGAMGHNVKVYNLNGATILSTEGSDDLTIPADPGFYVVTIGNHAFKVMVK